MGKAEPKEQDQDRVQFAALPSIAELDVKNRQTITALLESLDLVTSKKATLATEEDLLKNELEALQQELKMPGFRYGTFCFASQPTTGRRTLDKMLLLENGCPAAVLNASYKTGEPGTRRTFKRLDEVE